MGWIFTFSEEAMKTQREREKKKVFITFGIMRSILHSAVFICSRTPLCPITGASPEGNSTKALSSF